MLAAEKWYEYQTSYQKYGLEMKRRQVAPRPKKEIKAQPMISPKEKVMIMALTVCVGLVCIGLIASTAYAASIKYRINSTIKESAVLEGEIENLNVKIKSQTNIQLVEEKAKNELGMVYPTVNQYVYIDQVPEVKDFAIVLKAQAYN